MALQLGLVPVFPAPRVPVLPHESWRIFPAPRGERGSAALYPGARMLPAAGGSVRPGCPAFRPVQLKNNHPIVIVVTIVAVGQVRRKFVGAAFYSLRYLARKDSCRFWSVLFFLQKIKKRPSFKRHFSRSDKQNWIYITLKLQKRQAPAGESLTTIWIYITLKLQRMSASSSLSLTTIWIYITLKRKTGPAREETSLTTIWIYITLKLKADTGLQNISLTTIWIYITLKPSGGIECIDASLTTIWIYITLKRRLGLLALQGSLTTIWIYITLKQGGGIRGTGRSLTTIWIYITLKPWSPFCPNPQLFNHHLNLHHSQTTASRR